MRITSQIHAAGITEGCCLCEDHDYSQRQWIERIIGDIQDFIGGNHENHMTDDDDSDECDNVGFYGCEDLDIRLCDGAIKARLRQMEMMGDQEYYESSPVEVGCAR